VYFIVNTLGYIQRLHLWANDRQDAERTYEGIIRAFERFGGTVRKMLVDNQKARVIQPRVGRGWCSTSGSWTWPATMASPHGRLGRAEHRPRAKTSGW